MTADHSAIAGVLDQIDESVIWMDLSGKIIRANKSAILKTGYTQMELILLNVFDLYDGLSMSGWFLHVDKLLKQQRNNFKCKLITKSGKLMPIAVKTYLIESGSNTYVCAIIKEGGSESTETKRMERVVYEYDKLIYRLSHDLRSPISTIMGLVSLAKKGSTEEQQEYLRLIEVTLKKQNTMMTNVHHLSAIHTTPVQNLDINFPDLINDIISNIPKEIGRRETNWSFKFKLSEYFCNDYYLISKLLTPVIENSVQFTGLNGRKSEIDVSVSTKKKGADIKIEDNGIGIDEIVQDQVYEMFFRGSPSSKGSGLGLYLSSVAASKLNATIDFVTGRKGTTFNIFIPNCA